MLPGPSHPWKPRSLLDPTETRDHRMYRKLEVQIQQWVDQWPTSGDVRSRLVFNALMGLLTALRVDYQLSWSHFTAAARMSGELEDDASK